MTSARTNYYSQRLSLTTTLWGILAFTFLGVAAPALADEYTRANDGPWPIFIVVMIWAGARLARLIARGRPDLYSATCWSFVYIFLGLAPFLQVRLDIDPDTTPNIADATQWPAALAVIVGLLAFEVGYKADRALAGRAEARSSSPRELSLGRVNAMSILAIGTVAAVSVLVGIDSLGQSRTDYSAARAAAFPDPALAAIAGASTLALPLVTFHALVILRRKAKLEDAPGPSRALTWSVFASLIVINNPISNPRIIFGTVLLSIIVLMGATATRGRTRVTVLALVAGLTIAFPLSDIFRRSNTTSFRSFDFKLLAGSGDYDSFAQLTNTFTFVEGHGYQGIQQVLGAILFWVPRSLWSSKPLDTGILVAEARGYNFTNLSAPLWAEGYISAGYLGVAAVLATLGWLVGRGDRSLSRTNSIGSPAQIAGAILPFYMVIVMRGSLLQAMATALALVACIWAVSKRPRDPTARPA